MRERIETAVRGMPAPHAIARRHKIDRVRRALASGAALAAALGSDDRALRQQAEAMDATDPRLEWLLSQATRWREARAKTPAFVAPRAAPQGVRTRLTSAGA